jgi:hypothetical protein
LVGGLFASFSFYESLLSSNSDQTSTNNTQIIPSTGRDSASELNIEVPQPIPVLPGSPRSINDDTASANQVTSDPTDPRQPAGTSEFKNGDYKVYQYPDGRVIVVW